MGRPTVRRPRRGLNRREFLRRASWLPAAIGAQPLIAHAARGASSSATSTAAQQLFRHGVASGDPLKDRVMFWTRLTTDEPSVDVTLEIALDTEFAEVVLRYSAVAKASHDHTVRIDGKRLAPGTTYYYRFIALAEVSPVGRTRTLPDGEVSRLRMAVVSCSSYPHGYFNAYARIAERNDLDAVIHLGDYIYEYGEGEYGLVRPSLPAHEIVTLQDYRERHAQYKLDPMLQELHRQHPIIPIWDDHETANNAWGGGAENHVEGAEGSWVGRVGAALQAYYEWMPVRKPGSGELMESYRRFDFGNLLDLYMLETRLSARSEQLAPNGDNGGFTQTGEFADPSRQMLGEAQEQWLADGLRGSTARWHLLGQGVMMAQLKISGFPNATELSRFVNADQWDGYEPARQRLFDMLENGGERINNVVVLTGDIHSSWVSDLSRDPNNSNVSEGGYDPLTGAGSRAVEFVTTSVTSEAFEAYPGVANAAVAYIPKENPHIKYAELTQKGYLLLDVNADRVVGEYWYVDTVQEASSRQRMAIAFATDYNRNLIRNATQTDPKPRAPDPAP